MYYGAKEAASEKGDMIPAHNTKMNEETVSWSKGYPTSAYGDTDNNAYLGNMSCAVDVSTCVGKCPDTPSSL